MAEVPATALLALWNDVDPAFAAGYEDWHAVEHVPERLTVPGILWGLRFGGASPPGRMPHYLTLYGLAHAGVLDGEPYRRLLREPTPASRRMRPALRNLSRWVCTLHAHAGLDRGDRMAVRTSAQRPDDIALPSTALGGLLAERRDDAAPLPWLAGGQAVPVEGRWLRALLHAGGDDGREPAVSIDDAVVYRRLRVG